MPLAGKINLAALPRETKAQALGVPTYEPSFAFEWLITTGVGNNQGDLLYVASLTLAQSANADLDLNGVLLGAFGGAVLAMLKLKAFGIKAGVANPGNLTVGRGATNGVVWLSAVSAGVLIPPGGANLWVAPVVGVPIVAATADLINVASAATAGTYAYDVLVIGTSA